MKKLKIMLCAFAITYVVGALFTNSWVRAYRYDDWYEQSLTEQGYYQSQDRSIRKSQAAIASTKAYDYAYISTACWPAYLASSVFDSVVRVRLAQDEHVDVNAQPEPEPEPSPEADEPSDMGDEPRFDTDLEIIGTAIAIEFPDGWKSLHVLGRWELTDPPPVVCEPMDMDEYPR